MNYIYGFKVFNEVDGGIYSPVLNTLGKAGYELHTMYEAEMVETHTTKDGKTRVGGSKKQNGYGTGTKGDGSTLELAVFHGFHIYPLEFAPDAKQFFNKQGLMPDCKHLYVVRFTADKCYDPQPVTKGKPYIPKDGYYRRKGNGQGVPWYYITGDMEVLYRVPDDMWFNICPDIRKEK